MNKNILLAILLLSGINVYTMNNDSDNESSSEDQISIQFDQQEDDEWDSSDDDCPQNRKDFVNLKRQFKFASDAQKIKIIASVQALLFNERRKAQKADLNLIRQINGWLANQ